MSHRLNIRRNSRQTGRRRGNAVMEAALVLPILLALSFGTVEFGHFFYCKHTMQGAARDGARVAILPSSTDSAVRSAVANTMTAAGFATNQYTTTITNGSSTSTTQINPATVSTGTPIKVQVTATWSTIGIRPMNMISASKQVVGFTIMVKE